MNDIAPAPDNRLRIALDHSDHSSACFVLEGELDPHTAPMLQGQIDEQLDHGASTIVLDVAGVTFVDSAGLRVFADTHRRLADTGAALTVRSPSTGLQKLLTVSGLSGHLVVEA
ncbi:MAG: STAS domain-containing protein [Acidimicrobiales bacterium]|nr:STAS domain-containing protein [Acidimicrobiales bacterium]